MPLDKPLDALTEADLINLITNQEAEQQVIDYKKGLFLNAEPTKKEFRADVTSFANASGGHLVIGMEEKNGFPVALPGMEITNPDAFKMQIDEVLQTKIAPRVPGVGVRVLPLANKNSAAIIRIPRSFAKPHQITADKDDFQFWSRNSAGKYRLDVGELRSIILQSETLEERIRNFRQERLGSIIGGDTPVPLVDGARAVLHMVPMSAFIPQTRYDLSILEAIDSRVTAPLVSYRGNHSYHRYNLDGFLTTWDAPRDGEDGRAYLQVFRNGTMEAVDANYINMTHPSLQTHHWMQYNEVAFLNGLERGLQIYKALGIRPPFIVFISLLGVRGYRIYIKDYYAHQFAFNQDVMLLPDVLVENFDTPVDELLRPVFDAIWNEGGFAHCLNYKETGEHIRQ